MESSSFKQLHQVPVIRYGPLERPHTTIVYGRPEVVYRQVRPVYHTWWPAHVHHWPYACSHCIHFPR